MRIAEGPRDIRNGISMSAITVRRDRLLSSFVRDFQSGIIFLDETLQARLRKWSVVASDSMLPSVEGTSNRNTENLNLRAVRLVISD